MKADDGRPDLEEKVKPFFVECRDRFFRLRLSRLVYEV